MSNEPANAPAVPSPYTFSGGSSAADPLMANGETAYVGQHPTFGGPTYAPQSQAAADMVPAGHAGSGDNSAEFMDFLFPLLASAALGPAGGRAGAAP